MFGHLVRNLRRKPKAVRNNIALAVSGTVTVIVFAAWLVVTPEKVDSVAERAQASTGAFSGLFNQIKEQFNEAKANLPDTPAVNESLSELQTVMQADINASTTASTSAETATTTEKRPVRIATTTEESPENKDEI